MRTIMVVVLLLGCSSRTVNEGGAPSGGAGGSQGGAGGDAAGSAGAPSGGAGGSQGGAGGDAAAGSAGAPSGGAGGSQGGAGGDAAAGSAGAPSGGAGGSQGGSAGVGGAGDAAAGPSCTREAAFAVAALPSGWLWQAFSLSFGGKCASCAAAPCAACTAVWHGPQQPSPPTWKAGGVVRVSFDPGCGNASKITALKTGTCGAESVCGLQCGGQRAMELRLDPQGDGYVVSKAWGDTTASCILGGFNACGFSSMPAGAQEQVALSQDVALAQSLLGLYFPC